VAANKASAIRTRVIDRILRWEGVGVNRARFARESAQKVV
jgi:hypothetical protein